VALVVVDIIMAVLLLWAAEHLDKVLLVVQVIIIPVRHILTQAVEVAVVLAQWVQITQEVVMLMAALENIIQ
jgi:hypothetical protein